MDGVDPDRWDPDRWDGGEPTTEPAPHRPNRDALGQSLRAACGVMVAALLVLSVVLLPEVDRAVRLTVGYVVLPLLLAALFVALVAWSSPRAWTARRYAVAVVSFGAVVVGVVVGAGAR